ncbi:hypothetical protein BS47DRAFT_1368103 [Hydnum rufescens UP504]|uniref:Uncharacterized protein n=1 Tax=Hydnum rufescens UP504 TaxID=1448309 RepID=A0A9P6AHE9_9AGAM|nr:hypothetical protein BS47DRAFT_1368103 [Hydnum rufescens UP504]
MTTHPLKQVCGHKIKTKKTTGCPMSGPRQTKPQQTKLGQMKAPNEGMRGGDTNHTPAAAYRLNHPPNERLKYKTQEWERMMQGRRGPRQTTHPLQQVCGNFKIIKQNGDPLNEPPLEMKMGPTNNNHPNKTSDKTTHPLRLTSELRTRDPTKQTWENNNLPIK